MSTHDRTDEQTDTEELPVVRVDEPDLPSVKELEVYNDPTHVTMYDENKTESWLSSTMGYYLHLCR